MQHERTKRKPKIFFDNTFILCQYGISGGTNKMKYTVWVGGTEVNDFYLTKEQAEDLAFEYKQDGYDDVCIEEVEEQGGESTYPP